METPLENQNIVTPDSTESESPLAISSEKQLYCAKCYQTFGLEEINPDSSEDRGDSESDDDDADDTEEDDDCSPIFREDPSEIEERMLEEIDTFVTENPGRISRPTIEKEIAQEVVALLFDEWSDENLCDEDDLPDIREWVQQMVVFYFDLTQKRRQGGEPEPFTPLRKASIARKMKRLDAIITPAQRTQEWYETRYNLITASNLWKALGTEAQQNQLIVEKCQPFDQFKEDCSRIASGSINSDNPMAWGQKYEPVTALLYQQRNRTRLGEYGCIAHPDWPFLGASPDGINVDAESPLYGRMVEIKNIVNRTIDGVPSVAYWIQTQIQMEVCDLDECDFVETRFKGFATKTEWSESEVECKGVICTFVPRIKICHTMATRQTPLASPPPSFNEYWIYDGAYDAQKDLEEWIQSKKDQHPDFVLSTCDYWGLDQYSCVLIKRNREWFNSVMPKIEKIWKTILEERVTGSEHRAPKKRAPKTVVQECVVNKIAENEL